MNQTRVRMSKEIHGRVPPFKQDEPNKCTLKKEKKAQTKPSEGHIRHKAHSRYKVN